MAKDPMLDKVFLKELFNQKKRYIYAKVTTYDNDENPIESIEGRVTQGSINLDGKSSVRRSCSLTIMSSLDLRLEDELNWTLNTKIKVEIGMQNFINETYDDIIWFNMGFYCISNFSFVKNTSGCTVSLQGKDKMCLLNGDLGGEIYAAVDFGTEYIIDKTTGAVTPRQIPIEDIIREAVYEYAKEPYYNIDVEDIPKFGLFLLDYLGGTPFYILVDTDNVGEAADFLFNQTVYVQEGNSWVETQLDEIPEDKLNNIGSFINTQSWEGLARIKLDPNSPDTYYACRIESGETCGYEVTNLTYPKESEEDNSLSIGVGGTITQVLDKIVEFLGDYEYFFDVNGRFVFRKKNRAINTNDWSEIDTNTTGIGVDYDLEPSETNWNFAEEELVTQYNSSQKMGDIRNDFSIWGNKQTAETEVPIHLRYAIDFKPLFYRSINMSSEEIQEYVNLYPEYKDAFELVDGDYIAGVYSPVVSKIYYSKDCPFKDQINNEKRPGESAYEVDWREIIYQMAKDYLKFKHFDQFLSRLDQNNYVKAEDKYLYPKGKTKYEQYYVDLEANWRSLYAPRSQYEDDNGEITLVSKDEIKFVDNNNLPVPIYTKDRWYVLDTRNPYSENEGPTPNSYEGYDIYTNSRTTSSGMLVLTKNPFNLDLKKYLDYTPFLNPAEEDPALHSALSCYTRNYDDDDRYQIGYSDPAYFFRKGLTDTEHDWSFKNWLRLASFEYTYSDYPQFMDSGMGIFCDNYTNNSSTHFELFIDFKSKGFLPFDKIMSSYPGGAFSSRSVAKTDRYNLIIPIEDVSTNFSFITLNNYLQGYAEGRREFNSMSWAVDNDNLFNFYKIFKQDTTGHYMFSKLYHPGDKCYQLAEKPYYKIDLTLPVRPYDISMTKYYKGQIVIYNGFMYSPTGYYRCKKDTIPGITGIADTRYWEHIDDVYDVYQCIEETRGDWDRTKWYTDDTLKTDLVYYMLDSIESYENHNWRTLNQFVEVVPTYEGIKYADSGEYVYKLSVMSYTTYSFGVEQDNNKLFYSRVTSIEDLENFSEFKDKTYHFTVEFEQIDEIQYPKVVKNEYIDFNLTEDSGIIIRDNSVHNDSDTLIHSFIRDFKRTYHYGVPYYNNAQSSWKASHYKPRYFLFLKQEKNQYFPRNNNNYPWGNWLFSIPFDLNSGIGYYSPFSTQLNYKGTVGSGGTIEWNDLPAATSEDIQEGYTYKVITAYTPVPDTEDYRPRCNVNDIIVAHDGAWVKHSSYSPLPDEIGAPALDSEHIKENYLFTDLGKTGHIDLDTDPGHPTYVEVPIEYYQKKAVYEFEPYPNSDWNEEVLNNPEQMTFWFDFLHSEKSAQISKYGADKIMDRAKSESKDEVSAICFRDVLNIIYDFGESSEQLIADAAEAQLAIFNVPENLKSNFIVSNKYKSCKDVLDEWMLKYTLQNDAVSISATPILFLEPNQRILTPDGEYVINSISFPLTYNGMMNINATKVVEKLL